MRVYTFLVLLLLVFVVDVEARSRSVRRQFLASLGLARTPRGCQVDHWVPLMCGGPDTHDNLRLTCGPYMRAKERAERNCQTFSMWERHNPCPQNFCINPKE